MKRKSINGCLPWLPCQPKPPQTHTTRQTTSSHCILFTLSSISNHLCPFHFSTYLDCMDRLEAAMAKLDAAQLCFATTQASMESKLDALLLKLPIPITNHHYPSFSSVQSPSPPPLSRLVAPPCPVPVQQHQLSMPTSLPMPTLSPMPTPFPHPAPLQPSPASLPAPLPMPALHLPALDHVCAAIPIFDNLFSTVLRYGHTTAPHAKHGENIDIVLFELGPGFFGTIMVSCKCIPAVFALWTGA